MKTSNEKLIMKPLVNSRKLTDLEVYPTSPFLAILNQYKP